jgi:hypothetical protein
MVVYKVEKSNIFMLLQTYWDLVINASSESFEIFNIHIWLTPIPEKLVWWYFWRPLLTAAKIAFKGLESVLVKHLTGHLI